MEKIVHISTLDRKGGAAIAAYRLHEALLKCKYDSKMIVKYKSINSPTIIEAIRSKMTLSQKICNFLSIKKGSGRNTSRGQFSELIGKQTICEYPEVKEADIIYLHWICGDFVSYSEIENILKLGKPTYWILHDMYPITGGCHYAIDCDGYQRNCKDCPFWDENSIIAQTQLRKKSKLFTYDNLFLVATTYWGKECYRKSSLRSERECFVIPYSLNINKFKPIDKKAARELFGVEESKKVILFGAQSALTNVYKGFSFFKEALEILGKMQLEHEKIEIMVFGSEYDEKIVREIKYPINFLGNIFDEYSLVMAYNCADVFIIPSLAEAFGQTIIESLACGTPVVGFDVDGIPFNVNKNTGYLAKYKSSDDLAIGIKKMLFEKKPEGMREHVILHNEEKSVVNQHIEMWRKCQARLSNAEENV